MLRSIDIFPAPIGVRMNESSTLKTRFGGAMSILAILAMTFFSFGTLLSFTISDDEYKETAVIENLPYKNEITFELTDTEAIIAFQFVRLRADASSSDDYLKLHSDDGLDKAEIDKYLRYYFLESDK